MRKVEFEIPDFNAEGDEEIIVPIAGIAYDTNVDDAFNLGHG